MNATDTTYTAHLSTDDGDLALQITRDIPGGICGPFGGRIFMQSGATIEAVEVNLEAQGFRVGKWQAEATFEGLGMTSRLERVR